MPRALALLILLALPLSAQGQDAVVGGIGLLACREVVGPENIPYLAQVGDWALGYLAGRLDAGQVPVAGATLSPGLAADVVTGVALRCRQNPDMAVIDAVRAFAGEIFAEPPRAGAVAAAAAPDADPADPLADAPRPAPRPDRAE